MLKLWQRTVLTLWIVQEGNNVQRRRKKRSRFTSEEKSLKFTHQPDSRELYLNKIEFYEVS